MDLRKLIAKMDQIEGKKFLTESEKKDSTWTDMKGNKHTATKVKGKSYGNQPEPKEVDDEGKSKKVKEGLGIYESLMEEFNLKEEEFQFSPEQEKWLGGANRQDPNIIARMPGPKPPLSYFTDPADQAIAKQLNFGQSNLNAVKGALGMQKGDEQTFADPSTAKPGQSAQPAASQADVRKVDNAIAAQAGQSAQPAANTDGAAEGGNTAATAAANAAQPAQSQGAVASPVKPQPQVTTTNLPAAPAAAAPAAAPAAAAGKKITWQTIYNANKQVIGNNPNLIKPGQKLKMPDGSTYTVKPGDNLSKIAKGAKPGQSAQPAANTDGAAEGGNTAATAAANAAQQAATPAPSAAAVAAADGGKAAGMPDRTAADPEAQTFIPDTPTAAPQPAKSSSGIGPKITYKPEEGAPSIYAGPEKWAAYRAKQAGAKPGQSAQPASPKDVSDAFASIGAPAGAGQKGPTNAAAAGQDPNNPLNKPTGGTTTSTTTTTSASANISGLEGKQMRSSPEWKQLYNAELQKFPGDKSTAYKAAVMKYKSGLANGTIKPAPSSTQGATAVQQGATADQADFEESILHRIKSLAGL